ncbi:MAG: polymerase protein [Parcubacteria group bacterium GW2011_GWA1_50_14]|nr:MAG: polymerase protein [Parcubacteria group bacterium GW2011_GWA1_50_14]
MIKGVKTLLLIDANSLIHRSFHALPPFTAPTGEPVGALYGLSSILLRLFRDEKPEYAAALFDRPEPTHRKERYKEYKAQRPPAPNELISQIIEAHEVFSLFGIRTFEMPGFEADDLIATLAQKMKTNPELRVVILTGDLDTLQIVEDEKILVRTFKKGISDTLIYDEAAVRERYGLEPRELIDYKALVGDASDNVKGVPGVGPKTASELLKKYGTLENLFAHLSDEPKFSKKAEGFRAQAEFAKGLVRLEMDAPIEIERLADLRVLERTDDLLAYFGKLGFDSLVKRMNGVGSPGNAVLPGMAFPKNAPPLPSGGGSEVSEVPFVAILDSDKAGKLSALQLRVGFFLKAAMKRLWSEGKDLPSPYWDLGVAFWLIDPDLKNYEPEFVSEKFLKRDWKNAREDVEALYKWSSANLYEGGKRILETIEMPVLRVLAEIEESGISVSRNILEALDRRIEGALSELRERIFREAGGEFNINSPKQLAEIISKRLSPQEERGAKRTPGGKFSTNAESLEALKEKLPFVGPILEYRDGFKIQSTYVRPFLELSRADGKVHTDYVQTGTATGRLSSREPNMQNIPQESVWAKELRSAFVPALGFLFLALDYSQIELRVMAALSEDPEMTAAFEKGLDIHQATAAKVFDVPLDRVASPMRRLAKTLNFGLIYGMGASAFAKTSGLSREKAGAFIKTYFSEFRNVREWQERVKRDVRTFGYVETKTGRRRYLPGIASGFPRAVSESERAAVNHPIQGLAADIVKLAMVRVREELARRGWWNDSVRMLLTIHDELLFEVRESMIKESARVIREIMETAYPLGIPLRVEVSHGADWGHLERFTF